MNADHRGSVVPEIEEMFFLSGAMSAAEFGRLAGGSRSSDKVSAWRGGKAAPAPEVRLLAGALVMLGRKGADIRAALEEASAAYGLSEWRKNVIKKRTEKRAARETTKKTKSEKTRKKTS